MKVKKVSFPPRYFAGWAVLEKRGHHRKVVFGSAIMIPATDALALIYPANAAGYFTQIGPGESGRLRQIEYAISVTNADGSEVLTEKFSHEFKFPVILHKRSGIYEITPADWDQPLFQTFYLTSLFPPDALCVQFVA